MVDSRKGTIISVLLAVIVGAAGLYYVENRTKPFEMLNPQSQINLNQQFEDFLNAFLNNVSDDMKVYKAERKILIESVRAENLRDPAYVDENYHMVTERLVPSLHQKMDSVIANFSEAELKIDDLLKKQPEPMRKAVLATWDDVKDQQIQAYIDYFSFETDLLAAYQDLMTFYYSRKGTFETDLDARQLVFKDPADEEEEQQLKQKIADLYAAQKAARVQTAAGP